MAFTDLVEIVAERPMWLQTDVVSRLHKKIHPSVVRYQNFVILQARLTWELTRMSDMFWIALKRSDLKMRLIASLTLFIKLHAFKFDKVVKSGNTDEPSWWGKRTYIAYVLRNISLVLRIVFQDNGRWSASLIHFVENCDDAFFAFAMLYSGRFARLLRRWRISGNAFPQPVLPNTSNEYKTKCIWSAKWRGHRGYFLF